jgi:hypothetical protein
MTKSNSETSNSKSTNTLDHYIVTQRNEEYNDEGHEITEGYQVYQKKVFTDKAKAQKIADEMNFEFFKNMRPCDYGWGDCVKALEDALTDEQYENLKNDYCEISEVVPEKDLLKVFNKAKKASHYFRPFLVMTLEEDES